MSRSDHRDYGCGYGHGCDGKPRVHDRGHESGGRGHVHDWRGHESDRDGRGHVHDGRGHESGCENENFLKELKTCT